MKIKHIKFTILIFCILFFAGFNYFSLAAASNSNLSISLDSDNDGLSDSEENLYGTDPKIADTDKDGYSDGVEVRSGYNPIKPAPGDKLNTPSKKANQTTASESLTETFNANFKAFIESKNGQAISATEVKTFIDSSLANELSPINIDSIQTTENATLKIKSQKYASLSSAEKKEQLQKDAMEYINQVIYLLVSNAPTPIVTENDLSAFQEDFMNRLSDFSTPANLIYFSDLGDRLELFSQQLSSLEVPETMLNLHIKFRKLINGTLFLKDLSSSSTPNDPMGTIVSLTKIKDIINLFTDFYVNDFQAYLKQIIEN